ncbi:arylsulfatase [Flavobacterium sp. NG2]|uniref:arylsulfatase n=1 Tax=Flavobacterium sp. NG2 TaxID=3097547 RepID=UPI002A806725|nr:arylsulfatase [Flavobacterium sp. NG2]WPR70400.1 arylsulfatase [Flavobacterium sp. NG2]
MKILKTTVLLSVLILGCVSKNEAQSVKKSQPNVILIITDDQGYGDLGATGNTIIKTPNIDSFYNESYHLTDFHVGPTCAPTRSSLMTGRYANSVGVWHTVGGWSLLREDEKTLGDMFTQAGYITGAFGKWHLGDNYDFKPENRGFHETVMHQGGGIEQTPDYWGNTYFDDTYFKNGKPQKYKGYCTDVFFEQAINFIKTNKNKPFFCYLAPNAPHGPYNVPVEYYNLYKDLPETVLADKQKRFYGMISNIDDNFGKLRKALTKLKVSDNTILIYMTDNGTAAGYYAKGAKVTGYNAEMRGTKGSEYEGGHRVPFFIYWKDGKISTPKDIDELTAQLDIMPTLAEMCGIELPKDHKKINGKSILPLLRGTQTSDDRILVTDSQRIQNPEKWKSSAVMQNKWRLINGKELYDVANDKGQKNNIAAQKPDKVAEMRNFYENWWKEVSVDFDKEVCFKIGNKLENPITLTAHDVHAANGQQPWNQPSIREGQKGSGYWSVNILSEGTYELSLRRYPLEANLALNASAKAITRKEISGLEEDVPAGKVMNYVAATINFGNTVKEKVNVSPTDFAANFRVHLKAGKTTLNASFIDDKGEENVAYYVYIKKI